MWELCLTYIVDTLSELSEVITGKEYLLWFFFIKKQLQKYPLNKAIQSNRIFVLEAHLEPLRSSEKWGTLQKFLPKPLRYLANTSSAHAH